MFNWLLAIFIGSQGCRMEGQGMAFYYQGHLNDAGSAATGNYDFQFSLYDAPSSGDLVGGPVTNLAMAVASGLFATNINFGPVFTGTNYWLAIGVRTNGSINGFTLLQPRQSLLPVPYAIFASSASNLTGSLPATQLAGTVSSAQLSGSYGGAVAFGNSGNSFSGTFSGNGSSLTSLNGSQVTSGTVADARLSTNVALLNGNQKFTGSNNFTGVNIYTNRGNSFTGSFFGNGLVGWIPVSVSVTQAIPDVGYLLLSSNLTTLTLPPTNQVLVGDIIRVAGGGTGGWLVALNTNETILGNFLIASNNTWLPSTVTSEGWQSIASSADGTKLVASVPSGNGIYISTDSGKTWANSTTSYAPTSVASSASGSILYGVTDGGGIEYSTNAGASWNLAAGTSTASWYGIATSADGTKAAAIINGYGIFTSQNSGGSWGNANNAPAEYWSSIASSADGTKLAAVVAGGNVWTSVDSGTDWTQQTGLPTGSWLSIASSSDGSKLVAVAGTGEGGVTDVIYTSLNYGVSWTQSASAPSAESWYNVACSQDGGRIYAVANGGGIYASADFGLSWTAEPVPNEPWHGVASSADGSTAAAVYQSTTTSGMIYYGRASTQLTSTSTGTSGFVAGGQGSAVELQYIGKGQFMPVSMTGTLWAN